MVNRCVGRILELGALVGTLLLSATGGFVFMRAFRAVAMGGAGVDALTNVRMTGPSRTLLAGVGTALSVLTVVESEALAMTRALCR